MKNIAKTKPLVSVIMPVYNAGDYLVEAIESILKQTFDDFEFIIVDDASMDNSKKVIAQYAKKYPDKIRPIYLTRNRNNGGDACANEGYKIACGKFIARMDADDIAHSERLEKQVEYLETHKDIILLGTQAYVIDREGEVTGEKLEPTSHAAIARDYFIYHPIIHPSVMIRKSMLPKRKNLYTIRYNANNDLLTFFGLLKRGKFANLPEKLLYYRIHGKNDSLINPRGRFLNTLRIRLHAWLNLGYTPTAKAVMMNMVQLAIVFTVPSEFVMRLYKFWRLLPRRTAAVS